MFGKRKQPGSQAAATSATAPRSEPDLAAPRPKAPPTGRPADPVRRAPGQIVAPARRADAEVYGGESNSAAATPPAAPAAESPNEGRRLVVGRDIRLSGEIKKCDKLVVEGQVEASLTESRALEISETGLFSGDAVVEEAEISGCFEGELTVNGRLHIRTTGQVVGTVRYADIEIERGGRIAGSIDVMLPVTSEELNRPAATAPVPPAETELEDSAEEPAPEEESGDETPEETAEPEAAKTEGPANGAGKPLPLMERTRPDARS